MMRLLRITPELWVEFLKNDSPVTIHIFKNALPKDARCVGMETGRGYIALQIESDAFRQGDPIDLESPHMRLVAPA